MMQPLLYPTAEMVFQRFAVFFSSNDHCGQNILVFIRKKGYVFKFRIRTKFINQTGGQEQGIRWLIDKQHFLSSHKPLNYTCASSMFMTDGFFIFEWPSCQYWQMIYFHIGKVTLARTLPIIFFLLFLFWIKSSHLCILDTQNRRLPEQYDGWSSHNAYLNRFVWYLHNLCTEGCAWFIEVISHHLADLYFSWSAFLFQ